MSTITGSYLLIILSTVGTETIFLRMFMNFKNENMCHQAIQTAKVDIATGGDSEGMNIMFCVPAEETKWKLTWISKEKEKGYYGLEKVK